ncbi:MAG: hypothetical protein IEMM0008_0443 [bacterium]|nr:MAG: hypothetical protein IEMM0008_0443 [bacterium]
MKKKVFKVILLGFMMFVMIGKLGAQNTKTTADDIKKAIGLSVYVQAGFTFNLRNPFSQTNEQRAFDQKSNSFSLDLVQIQFAKEAEKGGLGFKFLLSAGETAKFIHSTGLGLTNEPFDLTQGYLEYIAPVGNGLKFTIGKFVTFFGAEVIEAKDNIMYSRSILFFYAIPFTHTGLKMDYSFSDAISLGLYVVNGWDNALDNNKGKTFGVSLGVEPIKALSMYFNFMIGPEQNNNSSDNRLLFDWVATITPVKALTISLNVDYGQEDKATATLGKAKWYGFAGIVKYQITSMFSLAARGEFFNDEGGTRIVFGTAQKMKEITITPEVIVAKGLILRGEYRHDWSDQLVFNLNSTPKKTQDTVSLSAMYTW